jgi:hypothetical protein
MKTARTFVALTAILSCLTADYSLEGAVIVLDFEGVSPPESDQSYIHDYYSGGAGPNYGVHFDGNVSGVAVGLREGGVYPFPDAPSLPTVAAFLTGNTVTMTVEGGFRNSLQFSYAARSATTYVTILNAENIPIVDPKELLKTSPNDFNHWQSVSIAFPGSAAAVKFQVTGGVDWSYEFLMDNVTLGQVVAVPEPPSWVSGLLFAAGIGGFVVYRRQLKHGAPANC